MISEEHAARGSDLLQDTGIICGIAGLECRLLVQVFFLNRSPVQAGCMKQVLGPGALGRPREIRWRGRWEEGLGWGIDVNPWLIHVNV